MSSFVNRRNALRLGAGAAAATLVGPGLVAASLPAAAQQNAAAGLVQRTAAQVLDLVMAPAFDTAVTSGDRAIQVIGDWKMG